MSDGEKLAAVMDLGVVSMAVLTVFLIGGAILEGRIGAMLFVAIMGTGFTALFHEAAERIR